jgi:predicted outer membrane repeat protein
MSPAPWPRRRKPGRRLLRLECLEDRALPAGFAVTTAADSGPGSLRQAVLDANAAPGPDTITFNLPAPTNITLTGGPIGVTDSVAVVGPGAATLAVSGGDTTDIFTVTAPGLAVGLSGLTFEHGRSLNDAGAVTVSNGSPASSLTLTGCVFSDNRTTFQGGAVRVAGPNTAGTLTVTDCTFLRNLSGGNGGAIDSPGATLVVTGSTFANNDAPNEGGAISVGTGTASVTNSTFVGNSASTGGALAAVFGATYTLTNDTITGNSATSGGGGVYRVGGAVTLGNTIVAGNSASFGRDVSGAVSSTGHNLVGATDGSSGWIGTDLTGTATAPLDPGLLPLGDYGGPTPTVALKPTGPAVGAGDPTAAPAGDQRGIARSPSRDDVGAFQLQTFNVTTPADSGPGSLRQAILDANAGPGPAFIGFPAFTEGPETLSPTSPLPAVTQRVAIDGTTQSSSSLNQPPGGTTAFMGVELDGSSAGPGDGLQLQGGDSLVRGLAVNRFAGAAIVAAGGGNVIAGNFLGTGPGGKVALANAGDGVMLTGGGNRVGGPAPADLNVIAGNGGVGVRLTGVAAAGNTIRNNLIGVAADGSALGNGAAGVRIENGAGGNTVTDNAIAHNAKGVVVAGATSTGNAIRGNSVFGNLGPGIDLGDDGRTPLGTVPRAAANRGQNAPVLLSAAGTTVAGHLSEAANATILVEFFASPANGPAGQGQTFLGSVSVTTDGTGQADFSATVAAVPAASVVTATATDLATNDTSEFSPGPPVSATAVAGSTPQSTAVGTAFATPLRVLVRDAYGNPVEGVPVAFAVPTTGPTATLNCPAVTTDATGTATVTATAGTAPGQFAVTATVAGLAPVNFDLTDTPGPAVAFVVTASPTAPIAGQDVTVTVCARDQFGNTATGYGGTVLVTSSDPNAVLPPPVTLTNGAGSFTVQFHSPGSQTVRVADSATASITGVSGPEDVRSDTAVRFDVAVTPSTAAAGQLRTVTVTARDRFGNVATGYNRTVHFASSDPQAGLPADAALSNGVGTFTLTLRTAGNQSLTVTDAADATLLGSGPDLAVRPGPLAGFDLSPSASPATAGFPLTLTVIARDAFGNVVSDFTGPLGLTASDPASSLPGLVTFRPADRGVLFVPVTLFTAGPQSLTVTGPGVSRQLDLPVLAAAPARLTLTADTAAATAGSPFNLTVTAQDAFGNLAGFAGTVSVSSDDPQASPVTFAFTGADHSAMTFVLRTAGRHTLTLTDPADPALTASLALDVTAAAAARFRLTSAGPATEGTAFTLTVTALDRFGNVANLYSGTPRVTSSDPFADLPAGLTFTTADAGQVTARVTPRGHGPETFSVSDPAVSGLAGSLTVPVANVAPDLTLSSAGVGLIVNAGQVWTVTGAVTDPGRGEVLTGTVDYHDGGGPQALAVGPDGGFTLSRTYGQDGTVPVTVTLSDGTDAVTATLFVHVVLPGVSTGDTAVAAVLPGQSGTVTVTGGTATLVRDPGGVGVGFVLLAVVPTPVAVALAAPAPGDTPAGSFDLRTFGTGADDVVVVTLHYDAPPGSTAVPKLSYFDPSTHSYRPVQAQVLAFDPVHHTITLRIDRASSPSILLVRGTVFLVTLPASAQPVTAAAFNGVVSSRPLEGFGNLPAGPSADDFSGGAPQTVVFASSLAGLSNGNGSSGSGADTRWVGDMLEQARTVLRSFRQHWPALGRLLDLLTARPAPDRGDPADQPAAADAPAPPDAGPKPQAPPAVVPSDEEDAPPPTARLHGVNDAPAPGWGVAAVGLAALAGVRRARTGRRRGPFGE